MHTYLYLSMCTQKFVYSVIFHKICSNMKREKIKRLHFLGYDFSHLANLVLEAHNTQVWKPE